MKKLFLCLSLICLILTGCGKQDEGSILKEFETKVNEADAYYLTGNMELVNNEDVYTYDITVSYEKDDHYKIELVNAVSDHEQVILRNEDGVYVITPSLNKSFKFQSDWPYNNSQVYLLSSLLDDITNDSEREFVSDDDGYVFTSKVNYPNNPKLVSQKVYFGSDYLPSKVEVMDDEGNIQIKMVFNKIDLGTEFNDTYFDINEIMDTEDNSSDNSDSNTNKDNNMSNSSTDGNSTNNTDSNNPSSNGGNKQNSNGEDDTNNGSTQETATIDDIIYPMYLPVNTYLTKQERVATEDGERLILTFTGDSSFVLMEETTSYSKNPEIIPTYGDIELIGSSLAVINDNSANWFDNGIEYYIVSDVMATEELLEVVKSISVLPVSK